MRGFFSATTLEWPTHHQAIFSSSVAHPVELQPARSWPTRSTLVASEITGEPTPVAERVRYESGLARGAFTVSETGTLVYGDIDRSSTRLTWFDRAGKALGQVGGSLAFGQPALSPDEGTIAVEYVDPTTQDQDLWLIDIARNLPSRFTAQGNNITFMPVSSPDGARIVFFIGSRCSTEPLSEDVHWRRRRPTAPHVDGE